MSKFSVDAGDRLFLALTAFVGVSLIIAGSWKALSWIGHGHLPRKDSSIETRTADNPVDQPHDDSEDSKSPGADEERRHSSKHHDHRHHHHHHHHKHAKSMGSGGHKNHTLHDKDSLEANRISQIRSRTEPGFLAHDRTEDGEPSSQILSFHETHDEPGTISSPSDGHLEETDPRLKNHRSSGLSGVRHDGHSARHQGSSLSDDHGSGSSVSAEELSRLLQRNIDDYLGKHEPSEDFDEKTIGLPGAPDVPGRRYRSLAQEEARLRKLAFEESKRAFKAGQKAEAKRLSDKGKYHDDNSKRYNALAAEEIFAFNNQRRQLTHCDLHGLHVDEALHFAKNHLVTCRASGTAKTMLIVGKGSHSQYGGARIKPAIMAMLAETGGIVAGVHEKNEGCIVVEFAARQ